jgi:cytochrome c oxidase subunit 4
LDFHFSVVLLDYLIEEKRMAHDNLTAHQHNQHIGYGTYILVWLALMVFTGLTVSVAGINLREIAIPVALGIAGTKAILVTLYFMHIKYEDRVFLFFLGIAFFTITVILILTFFDVYLR